MTIEEATEFANMVNAAGGMEHVDNIMRFYKDVPYEEFVQRWIKQKKRIIALMEAMED